jgi:hypothetical protein
MTAFDGTDLDGHPRALGVGRGVVGGPAVA